MKKFLSLIFLLTLFFVIQACTPETIDASIEFSAVVPAEIAVEQTIGITVKDKNGQNILSDKISITIKSGNDKISVTGLDILGLKAGTAIINIKVTIDGKSSNKDFTIVVKEVQELVMGIPKPKTGFYMKEADLIQEADVRYLVYITNIESGEQENVIAIRKGEKHDDDFAYSDEHIAIYPSSLGWDKYIGSPTIIKGNFKYANESYSYLIAYQGTNLSNEASNNIGLAVSNDPMAEWIKVGSTPVIEYDKDVYGESYKGLYAPSLVNMNKDSVVRLFYTWADAYGHFTYFADFNGNDLSNIDLSGFAMVPTNGNLSSGDNETMISNGSFAFDDLNNKFYMVKDYSPAPSQEPRVATRIELAVINEEELYTATSMLGWRSLKVYDMFDTPNSMYERLYSGTILTDQFGHLINHNQFELIYNISDLAADNVNHIFSQSLETFIFNID